MRVHLPRLLENIRTGAGPRVHAGMPVSPALVNILSNAPTPTVDEIVRSAMSNGAKPASVREELAS